MILPSVPDHHIQHHLEAVLVSDLDKSPNGLAAARLAKVRAAQMRIDAFEIERVVALIAVWRVHLDERNPVAAGARWTFC